MFRSNFSECFYHMSGMRRRSGGGYIHDVQQECGGGYFFQSGAKGVDESGGQVANEAEGIAQQDTAARRQAYLTDRGVEGCEHARIREDTCASEPVEQGR